ncbi:MAG TPA: hypothetical protein VIG94_02345 [Faecalibacter sp.]
MIEDLKHFCELHQGQYQERKYWYSPRAIITYNQYEIIFDWYTKYRHVENVTMKGTDARIFTSLEMLHPIKFEIRSKGFLDGLVNMVKGKRTLKLADESLNQQYNIASDQNNQLMKLLTPEILHYIQSMNSIEVFTTEQYGIWERPHLDGKMDLAATYSEMNLKTMEENLKLFKLLIDQMKNLNWIQ